MDYDLHSDGVFMICRRLCQWTGVQKGERNMLKVLLVDDEPFIIQGLKVLIDWEQEGL